MIPLALNIKRCWPWAAAAGSGLLLTACFPRWDQGWLCWVALTPLIAAVWFGGDRPPAAEAAAPLRGTRGVSPRRAAVLGYIAGLVFFWCVFSWLTTVTVAGWFLLPFYLALFPAAWAAFLAACRKVAGDFTHSSANLAAAALGAAAWTALEWLRGLGALSFGWNGLGVALHANLAMTQITEFTGVGGLSFLAAFANLVAVLTVRRFFAETQTRRLRPHWDFSLCMALIAAVFSYGVRVLFTPAPQDGTPLQVAAVQANIPQEQKFDRAFSAMIEDRYDALTETALATQPRLLLWPEAATPGPLFERQTFNFVSGFAQRNGVNFLLGSLDFDANEHDYNVAALFTPGEKGPQIYRKIHLVPFGEYIPFRKAFPPFEWIIGNLVPGDFTPGTRHTLLRLHNPDVNAAALICFEDTLGDLTRRFVADGAQFLINITNDGWFLQSQGAEQHLANARFRAIENRRPLLRAANTGVTAFIDPRGRITHSFRPDGTPFGEGFLAGTVQIPPANALTTFYTRHGDAFSQACAAASLLAAAAFACRRRKPAA